MPRPRKAIEGEWSYRSLTMAVAALSAVYMAVSVFMKPGERLPAARADVPVQQAKAK